MLSATIVAYSIYLAIPRYDYFLERTGTLVDATVTEEEREVDRSYSVHLKSSTGLEVDMRVLRPEVDVTEKLPPARGPPPTASQTCTSPTMYSGARPTETNGSRARSERSDERERPRSP